MSVLIKGMEMPKSCNDCCCLYDDLCWCNLLGVDVYEYDKERHPDCPLVDVPTPHGRLIDADEITEHKYTTIQSYRKKYADGKPKSDEEVIAFKFGWNYAIDAIVENAPTIIESEGER